MPAALRIKDSRTLQPGPKAMGATFEGALPAAHSPRRMQILPEPSASTIAVSKPLG